MKKAFYLMCLVLTGCGEKLAPDVEIKSVTYYAQHAEETERVFNECLVFRNNKVSTMKPNDQEAYMKTSHAANCSNAAEGKMAIYQQKLRDAAAKY